MEQQLAFEEKCERYLLGELSEAEHEQFEEDYFADDALFEGFLAVKDELLDLYARGELAGDKRIRFEQHFLTTAPRRGQLDETQEFIRAVTAVSTNAATSNEAALNAPPAIETPKSSRRSFWTFFNQRPFAWQFALAAVLLAVLFGGWIFIRNWRQQTTTEELAVQKPTPATTTEPAVIPPTNQSDNGNANNNTAVPGPTPANIKQPKADTNAAPQTTPQKTPERPPQISPPQIASVILLPVASRSINKANTIRLGSDTRSVRLSLVFKNDDYRSYSAALTTVGGAGVWRQNNLKSSNKSVTLQFAPALLKQQDYIVILKGQTADGKTETVNEYYFRVVRD